METYFKKYYPIPEVKRSLLHNSTHVKIEVYYDLGGINYVTGNTEPRGIYLGWRPVKVNNTVESFIAFNGTKLCGSKLCLKELKRNSRSIGTEIAAKVENIWKELAEEIINDNNARIADLIKAI